MIYLKLKLEHWFFQKNNYIKRVCFPHCFFEADCQETILEQPGQDFCLEITLRCNWNHLELKMLPVSLAGLFACPPITIQTDLPWIVHPSAFPVLPRSSETVDFARSWIYCWGSLAKIKRKKGACIYIYIFWLSASIYKWTAKRRKTKVLGAQGQRLIRRHRQVVCVVSPVLIHFVSHGRGWKAYLRLDSQVSPLILGLNPLWGRFKPSGTKGPKLRPPEWRRGTFSFLLLQLMGDEGIPRDSSPP